jgi:hypothetical protein
MYIYCSKNGLAAVNKKVGCTLVTRAPKWNVILYNDKTKVYYSATLKEWMGEAEHKAQAKDKVQPKKDNSVPPRKVGSGSIAGIRAVQYIVNNPDAFPDAKRTELWMSNDMEVPNQLTQILGRAYGVNLGNISGFPLRFSYIDFKGKRTVLLNTLKTQAQVIPSVSFNYPAHYKRVENELLVVMDENNKETLNSFLNDPASQREITRLLDSENITVNTKSVRTKTASSNKKLNTSDAELQKYMDLFKSLQQK